MTTWEGSSTRVTQAFREFRPDVQRLVRALAVLGGPSISMVSVGAVLAAPKPRAAETVATLAAAGWGAVSEDRFEIAADAREHLAELVPSASPAEVDQILGHVAAVAKMHTSGMPPAIRTDIANVIQAATRYHRISVAAAVARVAWRSPTTRGDLAWCRELARHGEEAAIADRQPELLIELLNNSAEVYASASDWPGAELAWLRALAVVEDLGDTVRSVRFLNLLATNYLNWKRPHKAVDMLIEIVSVHERSGDPVRTAEAQTAVARTMADAGRTDAATKYLGRADRLLRACPNLNPEVASLHATILSEIGQVYVDIGRINTARNRYHRALGLVIDTDEQTANRIRALQAALPNQ